MNKTKISFGKIGKYIREISVVVIGVAITLSASYWITNRNEKKNMALYLSAIKLELKENMKILEETNQILIQPSVNYSDYLRSHDKKNLNVDTLKYYFKDGGPVFNASSIRVITNAFDMFKTSDNVRLVNNKELLLSIWDSYVDLVELKELFDMVAQWKLEDMKKYLYSNRNPFDEGVLKNPPLYEFYVTMDAPDVQRKNSERVMALLNETISKLEK